MELPKRVADGPGLWVMDLMQSGSRDWLALGIENPAADRYGSLLISLGCCHRWGGGVLFVTARTRGLRIED
jgi:hypothetical protein